MFSWTVSFEVQSFLYAQLAERKLLLCSPLACGESRIARFLSLFKRPKRKGTHMETRIAVIGIVVENTESVEALNGILHQYGEYIIGRMGIPYRKCGVNIVSIAIDAPQDIISALSGKIGRLSGVSAKAAYSNVVNKNE